MLPKTSSVRDRQLTLNPEIASALLQVINAVRQILTTLEGTGSEGDRDYTGLVERLQQLQGGNGTAMSPVCRARSAAQPCPLGQELWQRYRRRVPKLADSVCLEAASCWAANSTVSPGNLMSPGRY